MINYDVMQTFLPYSDYKLSAKCLDNKRLGKQRVEAKQIIDILLGKTKLNKHGKISWINHPAVKMWRGYELNLSLYMNIMIEEWIRRGFNNSMEYAYKLSTTPPPWMGNSLLHASHRSNLLRKNIKHYSQFSWVEPINLAYYWPV